MDKDDDVLQSDLYENFPEEAIPLVIFNEQKKRKCYWLNVSYHGVVK